MNKVKLIKATGIRARVNEMNKTHEEIGVVEDKIYNLLDNAKCKTYALHAKKSNLAESRHEEKEKTFESLSRNMIITENHSIYGKMAQHALCA